MKKLLLVGGGFGTLEKSSALVTKLQKKLSGSYDMHVINGSTLKHLHQAIHSLVPYMDIVIWLADVSNNAPKMLPLLKRINPKILLIASKRMDDRDLRLSDVIGKMLLNKVNLNICITKTEAGYFNEVIDPLGNIFYSGYDIRFMISALVLRMEYLSNAQRKPSRRMLVDVKYEDDGFLKVVKEFGNRFAQFVEQLNPNRLLGNASTRCSFGFPSTKQEGMIFVSRRNVDKKTLNEDSMVPVVYDNISDSILYGGHNKPSVDTPIQVMLYEKYPHINYIIHGHCYVKDAPMTEIAVPCGDVRELKEISKANGYFCGSSAINLKGHGCLIMAEDLKFFDHIRLKARPFLEKV